jgi:DNA repair protein RecO (recombination protein O)
MTRFRLIILKTQALNESDLIVHGLDERGRLKSLMAKGAQKSRKRFGGGVLEPTHFIQVELIPSSENRNLPLMAEAHLLEDFSALREDYDRLSLSFELIEISRKASGENESPDMFNLLGNSLRDLSRGHSLPAVELSFLLRFLLVQGVLEIEAWMKEFMQQKDRATYFAKNLLASRLTEVRLLVYAYLGQNQKLWPQAITEANAVRS